MTELEALRIRRSVRKYVDTPLRQEDMDAMQAKIDELNRKGDLHFQLVINERKAFRGFLSYGKFSNVSNYIMVVGRESDTLEYRAGYYGEELVIYAQSIGLSTCFVGLTYKKIDGAFKVGTDERVLLCIALGYAAPGDVRVHKLKRPVQVSNIDEAAPEWFKRGVETALLAPTAVNQQKFYFEYIAPNKVRPRKGNSLVGYTKIDLGIAMYNFEVGAGKESFCWVESPL
ncbi:MAG: nitroreductase [Muribaculaceae bacterium]|nr:nitroreductase [Muribaculaceae bacterium]